MDLHRIAHAWVVDSNNIPIQSISITDIFKVIALKLRIDVNKSKRKAEILQFNDDENSYFNLWSIVKLLMLIYILRKLVRKKYIKCFLKFFGFTTNAVSDGTKKLYFGPNNFQD